MLKFSNIIAYARPCYRIQGVTLNESYNIWEWNQMSSRCKYTAISRATSKDLINIIDDSNEPAVKEDIPETDHDKLTRNKYQREKLEVERRRQESHTILMNIINSPVTDDYNIEHTQKTRQDSNYWNILA